MRTPARIEAIGLTKQFGTFRALDNVGIVITPGSFHAVVGENGAGKSTLAKCLLGFYRPDAGEVRMDGVSIHTPAEARNAGLGMVFQHFTLAPSMTVAENLLLARSDLPAIIDWLSERQKLKDFLRTAPFPVDLDSRVEHLAAGEKQKVEILKQLYLRAHVLILDEPTSVLTPTEADEVMTILNALVRRGSLSVLLITHKLREVVAFADEVTVMRRGRWVACEPVADVSASRIAELMMGDAAPPKDIERIPTDQNSSALEIRNLTVMGDHGVPAVRNLSLTVRSGEILGVAGVSGNGQRELVQAIGGQREIVNGEIRAFETSFQPSREVIQKMGLFTLPEEPLQNATVPGMSVAENLALRRFDRPPMASGGFLLNRSALRANAEAEIARFSIRTPSPWSAIKNLSGGNVQRAVLARDLGSHEARIMVVANPCFGLDFAATTFVHNQLIELRNSGGSVLLISEDLDEIMKLADRILVISEGVIAHETLRSDLDLSVVGQFMGGHVAR
jgi:general nucleoside transport system ATP-binding protein